MTKKIKFEPEVIFYDKRQCTKQITSRAKVFGGWLVYNYTYSTVMKNESIHCSESMVFIPDPNHEWEIDKS